MSIFGSRDTSQGRWEWPVAVVWLPDFVARLVCQVRLIPEADLKLCELIIACSTLLHNTLSACTNRLLVLTNVALHTEFSQIRHRIGGGGGGGGGR